MPFPVSHGFTMFHLRSSLEDRQQSPTVRLRNFNSFAKAETRFGFHLVNLVMNMWWTCDEITLTRLKYKLESEMLKNHGKSTYTIIQHKYAFSRFAYISRCMCCTCQWPYALCQFQNCITDITEAGIHWIILNHIGSCRINWIHDDLQAVLLDQFLTDVLRQVRAAQVARVGEEVMVSRLTSD